MKSKFKIYTPSRTLTNKEEIEKEICRISNDVFDVMWDYLARYARECVDPYGEEHIVVTSLCVGTRRGERGKLFFDVQAYEGNLKDAFLDDTTMHRIAKTTFDGNWDTVMDKLMQKSYYEMTEDEQTQYAENFLARGVSSEDYWDSEWGSSPAVVEQYARKRAKEEKYKYGYLY